MDGESSAEAEIARLVHAYTERVGHGDLEGIADLFAHGAVSGDAHPDPAVGRDAVLALYRTTLATHGAPRRLRASTTDLQIEVDEADGRATCESRFVVHPPDPASYDEILFVGRYSDRFARIDGRWQFTRRHVHLDVTNADAAAREGVHLGD